MRPLFLAPLRLEARAVRRGAPGASVERIGMGPVAATRALARLGAAEHPERPVAVLGVAGGLSDDLRPGEVVVASHLFRLGEGAVSVELPQAPAVAERLEAAGLSVRLAPITCSPRIVRGKEARAAAAAGGAVAVEMESYWLAPLLRTHPLCVVRVVLDTPAQEIVSASMITAVPRALRALAAAARGLSQWRPSTFVEAPLSEVGDA